MQFAGGVRVSGPGVGLGQRVQGVGLVERDPVPRRQAPGEFAVVDRPVDLTGQGQHHTGRQRVVQLPPETHGGQARGVGSFQQRQGRVGAAEPGQQHGQAVAGLVHVATEPGGFGLFQCQPQLPFRVAGAVQWRVGHPQSQVAQRLVSAGSQFERRGEAVGEAGDAGHQVAPVEVDEARADAGVQFPRPVAGLPVVPPGAAQQAFGLGELAQPATRVGQVRGYRRGLRIAATVELLKGQSQVVPAPGEVAAVGHVGAQVGVGDTQVAAAQLTGVLQGLLARRHTPVAVSGGEPDPGRGGVQVELTFDIGPLPGVGQGAIDMPAHLRHVGAAADQERQRHDEPPAVGATAPGVDQ